MANQVRYNADKLKLSYWLGTRASAFVCSNYIEIGTDASRAAPLERVLRLFIRGDDNEYLLLDALMECAGGRDTVAEHFTRACMYGEHKYFRGGFMIGAPISHYCDSAARHLKALRNEGPVYIESYTPKSENGEQVATVTCTLNHWEGVCWNVVMIFEVMNAAPQRDDRLFHKGDYSGNERIQPPARISNGCSLDNDMDFCVPAVQRCRAHDEQYEAAIDTVYQARCEPCDGRYSYTTDPNTTSLIPRG